MPVSSDKLEEAKALAIRRGWITVADERIFVQAPVSIDSHLLY